MKFKFLANSIRNKRFDYSPMHYDERKERLDLKRKEFERLENSELHDEDRKTILRQNMQESWSRAKYAQNQRSSSNLRVLLLIAILFALGYLIFNGVDGVDQVVKKLW